MICLVSTEFITSCVQCAAYFSREIHIADLCETNCYFIGQACVEKLLFVLEDHRVLVQTLACFLVYFFF